MKKKSPFPLFICNLLPTKNKKTNTIFQTSALSLVWGVCVIQKKNAFPSRWPLTAQARVSITARSFNDKLLYCPNLILHFRVKQRLLFTFTMLQLWQHFDLRKSHLKMHIRSKQFYRSHTHVDSELTTNKTC